MTEGETVICQFPNWYNAFGEHKMSLEVGQRLTVTGRKNINGTVFLYFKETPEDTSFLATGFKALRNLN